MNISLEWDEMEISHDNLFYSLSSKCLNYFEIIYRLNFFLSLYIPNFIFFRGFAQIILL